MFRVPTSDYKYVQAQSHSRIQDADWAIQFQLRAASNLLVMRKKINRNNDAQNHPQSLTRSMPVLDSEEEDNSSPASLNSSPNPQESRPPSNKRPSFEFDLEAQLLQDIENSGGIHSISLRRICDLKPFLYGEKNSKERKRIQNKVNRWKHFKSKEYKQLLCNLLPDRYPATPTTPPLRPLHSANKDNKDEDEEEESQELPPAASRRIQFASPLSTHQQFASTLSTAVMLTTSVASSSMNKNVTYIQRILAADEYGMYFLISVVWFCFLPHPLANIFTTNNFLILPSGDRS